MPPPRRCYERRRIQEGPGGDSAVVGAASPTATRQRAALPGGTGTVAPAGHPVRGWRAQGRQIPVGRQPRPLAGGRLAPHRVLICQFELPVPQFVGRLAVMRRVMGSAADLNLLVDTRATGHLLCAPQGMNHFLAAAKASAAEVIILDPLYSTHDQDENDTRSMAALCQSLLRLRDASKAALIVV